MTPSSQPSARPSSPPVQVRAEAPASAPGRSCRPTVSVCIVGWNCRRLLRQCLRSLSARRQGVSLEIILVDNASTDGAPEMAARRFPHVRLIRNAENRGFAAANNQAVAVSRGRFLFFLNNDTVVPRGALARLVAYARANPDVGLLGPRLRDASGATQVSWRARPTVAALLHRTWLLRWTGLFRGAYRRYRGREAGEETARRVEVLMGAALLVRRKLFRRLGGWDEGYTFGGEDVDLCARVGRTHAVVYHPGVSITHYGRVSSRRHIGYAHTNTLVGMVRFLRSSGTPRAALLAYKVALTLDAPAQWLQHALQLGWRRLRGRTESARKSRVALRGAWHFLSQGLPRLWKT